MQSNNQIWPFLEYQPWGAGYSDVQVVHLNMGKLYQRGEARKMSRWYRQKDITIKMISSKRYYNQDDIAKKILLSSKRYYNRRFWTGRPFFFRGQLERGHFRKPGIFPDEGRPRSDGQVDWSSLINNHNEFLVADAKIFYHGGSFIIRALAKKQCKSNSDVDLEHVCHEHTWQQVSKNLYCFQVRRMGAQIWHMEVSLWGITQKIVQQ